ncbi:MAG: type VI secretion system lipoprotein TssJ [Deltaproteobacteria bacterium]|nr:type VI secretion system lipoprotein TssJ [Deltaproteobacteria bacterium]MBW2597540.1 type VI secretion system lipoprotein TssJ [Deltaproteobacteria bacterium]MBW2638710.1 type VI secretion system lipoprotein TssJ [Deltaproteobacteria bacterium]MBW2679247.1 type VI secretion system lipoprotein TssJ [Deltaproteobacteria bacterium]
MKHYLKVMFLVMVSSIIYACASQPLLPPQWQYEKEAIKLHIKADPKLNLEEGTPHTLLVCVYQLKDPNAFNQLAGDDDGLYKLLECGLFDAAVATSKRLIARPGQDITLALDRAEGAKYLAVVAGYFTLQKDRMIRLFNIPVVVEEKGFIKRKRIQKPGLLNIELILGQQQILSVEGK